jgi:hypothetical protein
MIKFLLSFSFTKLGTIITILSVILSLPEVGAVIPPALLPYWVVAVQAIMFLKRTFWPKEVITTVPVSP